MRSLLVGGLHSAVVANGFHVGEGRVWEDNYKDETRCDRNSPEIGLAPEELVSPTDDHLCRGDVDGSGRRRVY